MAEHVHRYVAGCRWSGSTAVGYDRYDRGHEGFVRTAEGSELAVAPGLLLSGDPAFGGSADRLNPEQLLVLAASSCQLLSFLAVAARARLDVVDYEDVAEGEMPVTPEPTGLTRIVLRPRVTLVGGVPSPDRFSHLVQVAHRECFIANSLSTPVVVRAELVAT
jgi:organic hydroperoxide reductase OsmC/OhrA